MATKAWLRRHFPTKMPVLVKVVPHVQQPDLHGVCLLGDDRALIKITEAPQQVMIDTLLEEWAHVLRQESPIPYEEDEHDQLFWAILAAITKQYRGE